MQVDDFENIWRSWRRRFHRSQPRLFVPWSAELADNGSVAPIAAETAGVAIVHFSHAGMDVPPPPKKRKLVALHRNSLIEFRPGESRRCDLGLLPPGMDVAEYLSQQPGWLVVDDNRAEHGPKYQNHAGVLASSNDIGRLLRPLMLTRPSLSRDGNDVLATPTGHIHGLAVRYAAPELATLWAAATASRPSGADFLRWSAGQRLAQLLYLRDRIEIHRYLPRRERDADRASGDLDHGFLVATALLDALARTLIESAEVGSSRDTDYSLRAIAGKTTSARLIRKAMRAHVPTFAAEKSQQFDDCLGFIYQLRNIVAHQFPLRATHRIHAAGMPRSPLVPLGLIKDWGRGPTAFDELAGCLPDWPFPSGIIFRDFELLLEPFSFIRALAHLLVKATRLVAGIAQTTLCRSLDDFAAHDPVAQLRRDAEFDYIDSLVYRAARIVAL